MHELHDFVSTQRSFPEVATVVADLFQPGCSRLLGVVQLLRLLQVERGCGRAFALTEHVERVRLVWQAAQTRMSDF